MTVNWRQLHSDLCLVRYNTVWQYTYHSHPYLADSSNLPHTMVRRSWYECKVRVSWVLNLAEVWWVPIPRYGFEKSGEHRSLTWYENRTYQVWLGTVLGTAQTVPPYQFLQKSDHNDLCFLNQKKRMQSFFLPEPEHHNSSFLFTKFYNITLPILQYCNASHSTENYLFSGPGNRDAALLASWIWIKECTTFF